MTAPLRTQAGARACLQTVASAPELGRKAEEYRSISREAARYDTGRAVGLQTSPRRRLLRDAQHDLAARVPRLDLRVGALDFLQRDDLADGDLDTPRVDELPDLRELCPVGPHVEVGRADAERLRLLLRGLAAD